MGIVTRDDLLAASTDADAPVLDVASLDVVTAHPDLSVRDALGLMLGEDVDHLPVLDEHNQLIGICTRTDVLRAKMPQFHHEIRQPGWVPRRTRP